MATRPTKKRHSERHGGPESAEQMVDRVVGAFEQWLVQREFDPTRVDEVAGIARMACELKSYSLGEANPADWGPRVTDELVGEVLPRKVVGVDQSFPHAVVPAMLTYVDFLVTTGRWKPHNDSFATRRVLLNLEADLPGRFTDPARQSMGGRLAQLALEEGVDLAAPGAFDGFVQRSNDMPDEWRRRLTDSPGLTGFEDDPFGDPEEDGGLWTIDPDSDDHDELVGDQNIDEALAVTAGLALAALGFEPGEVVAVTVPDAESELAALLDTPLLRRIRALSAWARAGRRVTSSGAMRLRDTTAWLTDFDIVAPPGSAAGSMWDWPELAAPWSIAIASEMIDISGTKARAGANSLVFDSADLPTRISCARTAVDLLIASILDTGDEPSDLDVAVAMTLVPALALMCRPDGVDLAEFRALAVPTGPPAEDFGEALTRIVVSVVANILEMLQLWGIAVEDRGRALVPERLRPALVQAIYAPEAPFSITLAAKAIPLVDDPI